PGEPAPGGVGPPALQRPLAAALCAMCHGWCGLAWGGCGACHAVLAPDSPFWPRCLVPALPSPSVVQSPTQLRCRRFSPSGPCAGSGSPWPDASFPPLSAGRWRLHRAQRVPVLLGRLLLPSRCHGAAGLQELVSPRLAPARRSHGVTGEHPGVSRHHPRSTCAAGRWHCPSSPEPCPSMPCATWEFSCRADGRCVPGAWVCDNEEDCGDGSDELCAPRCAPHQHRCASGQCLAWGARCDGVRDCSDGSDESGCPTASCAPPEFACASGHCIPPERVCDGELDCGFADDSDEAGERPHECPMCPDTQCLPPATVCDGHRDCANGTDEEFLRASGLALRWRGRLPRWQ
uniref:Uncharacterized protein n=1 Tax=Strigops habroptila TaxID=2489341 RepID=A0A672TVH6_STRHB